MRGTTKRVRSAVAPVGAVPQGLDVGALLDDVAVPVEIWSLPPRGEGRAHIVYMNPALAQLLGSEGADPLRSKSDMRLGLDMDPADVGDTEEALRSGERVVRRRRIRRPDGTGIWAEVTMTPQLTPSGVYVVGVTRDTEQIIELDERAELRFLDVVLDRGRRDVWRRGRHLDLTPTEFSLLELFLSQPRKVLSRPLILERAWGYPDDTRSHVVDVYVGYLRRKLEAHGPRLIQTVRGVGYILDSSKDGDDSGPPG